MKKNAEVHQEMQELVSTDSLVCYQGPEPAGCRWDCYQHAEIHYVKIAPLAGCYLPHFYGLHYRRHAAK
jgi:hypothetical protein